MMNAHRGKTILSDIGAFQRGENVQEQVKKKNNVWRKIRMLE